MQIELKGLQKINAKLQELEENLVNTRPLVGELTNHLYNLIEESFETQTTPDGKSWSPIKKATHKNYGLSTDKILYKTGHMRNSLYHYSVIGGGGAVGVNATAKGYMYPLVHQYGSKFVEARPFMPIKADGELYEGTQRELDEIMEEWFTLQIS